MKMIFKILSPIVWFYMGIAIIMVSVFADDRVSFFGFVILLFGFIQGILAWPTFLKVVKILEEHEALEGENE